MQHDLGALLITDAVDPVGHGGSSGGLLATPGTSFEYGLSAFEAS
jgi:hypothetical protein